MNARLERAMNSMNLGIRIMENRALNQKIWALEAFKDKTIILGGSRVILEIFEWFEGLGAKDRASCEVWRLFKDFGGFLECLERFMTYSSIFFGCEGVLL
jgi:hypothetical protein